jgi:oxalate decarboxylase/phosphoglucose isomerase-like protein (cupin superfamily)
MEKSIPLKIPILDLETGLVDGISVQMPDAVTPYQDTYFEWNGSSLISKFRTTEISGGTLKAWHHVPVFREIETHIDAEMFYFISGVAIMLFMDVEKDQPTMDSAQIVRIQPGTQIIIPESKGHFVPVAEGNEPVEMIVVSPKMDAPKIALPTLIEGVA